MKLTRRDFVRDTGVAVIGFSLWKAGKAHGRGGKVAELPILWLTTGACSGCTAALLDSASPHIEEALLEHLVPGKHLQLAFHTTLMASAGELAMNELKRVAQRNRGRYLLVVEGAIPTKEDGRYCQIGEQEGGRYYPAVLAVRDLARDAKAVLAVGTCGSFGGIAAAKPNPTGAVGVGPLLAKAGVKTPVVNIPGCPPHPDWIVGAITGLALRGPRGLPLDKLGRPKAFFSTLVHDNCPYRADFDRGRFAQQFGQHACLFKLGCKGPIAFADCPTRRWSSGQNWCVGSGHPCVGCTRSDFPYEGSLFGRVEPSQLGFPAVYPEASKQEPHTAGIDTYVTIGLLGIGGFAAGVGTATAVQRLKKQESPPEQPQPPREGADHADGR